MKTYRVKCGYRIAGNFPACTTLSTHFDVVTVTVDDAAQVRSAAIDALYAKHPDAEHVKPCLVLRED